MSQSDRSDELKELINSGQTERALELAKSPINRFEPGGFVCVALQEGASDELLDATLEAFLISLDNSLYWKENKKASNNEGVLFFQIIGLELWKSRKVDWIKRLNEAMLKNANELGDHSGLWTLVVNFWNHAIWSDDPADYHLNLDNLSWWEYRQGIREWISHGKFESEEDFLRWRLGVVGLLERNSKFDMNTLCVDSIIPILERLAKLGVDTSEMVEAKKAQIREYLPEMEAKLTEKHHMDQLQMEEEVSATRRFLWF